MTPVERRKHMDVFHMITWVKDNIDKRLAILACSDPTPHNHGARMVLEDLRKSIEAKHKIIVTTGKVAHYIGRR